MNNKPRVLLTASYGPNELGWGEDMYDLTASRTARGQGVFKISSHAHFFALYLIAENITNPTTVLENPHWDEFERELDEGYDVVGFQLKSLHTAKTARMMKHIREKYPKTRIVVGGYGVGTLDQPVPGDTKGEAVYIRENADHLCREEGVRFMRRILDDGPIDREITQYHLPMCGMSIAGIERRQVRFPSILVALGCPNACDFCNTSAFFNYQKIYVADPGQVYRFMKNYQKRLGQKELIVNLFDEDFFLDPDYVRELGRLIRSDKDTWGVRWSTHGSIRSISQFTSEELRDCGCGSIWIGVESFMCGAEGPASDQYAKCQGKEIKQTFEDLNRYGINITASMVLGFDFHNRENLKEDIDQFVALKPTLYNIAPLVPCPGTALYERMLEDDRILDSYKWEDLHLWSGKVYKPMNFEKGEIKEFYEYAHEQLRDLNGPPPLRIMENCLNSYLVYKDATDDFHSYQAEISKKAATEIFAYLRSVKLHHHSQIVREQANMLEQRYRDEIGRPTLMSKVISYYISRNIKKKLQSPLPPVVSDPPPRWSYYTTFDDKVWVRKGREAGKPVPYRDETSFSVARFIRKGRL